MQIPTALSEVTDNKGGDLKNTVLSTQEAVPFETDAIETILVLFSENDHPPII